MSTDRQHGELLLGRYRVRHALGEGAHGRVYLADDLARGGSRVALKIVPTAAGATSANPAETVLRWFRHPAWAAVYDAGPLGDDARFQVTRFIPGTSLDQVTGAQPKRHVWRLLEDMARVLRGVHGQGLIHYDLTPGNVIRQETKGEISFVLTDGGLAHVGPVQGAARGTPQFMAPELTVEGEHDHRVDLYSLGLVAYRMATGTDPFAGGAGEVLKARREHDAPRPSTHVPSIPKELDDLIATLLSRNPAQRPFDADSLLEHIRNARRADVPMFTEAEAMDAATGGPLVGRRKVLSRFLDTTRQLGQLLPREEGRKRRSSGGINEPVLLVRGEPGSGATHLIETLFAGAREEGIPAVLMAGRERAADRRGPLRRLVDGLATLGLAPGEEPDRVRLDLRRGEGLHREERAHARGRALEVFLKAVEDTAERTPFVIVVEDFPDLPPLAQEAVRVLSRHLLSKAEHGARQAQPPLALIVDLGASQPDELLIPDSPDPRACLVELPELAADDLEAICQARFGGLELLAVDKDRIRARTEGRPALLAGLLSEAIRRGDLAFSAERWNWDINDLDAYPMRRGLSPQHAEALAALSDEERRVLEQMSQVDNSLPAATVDALCERAGLARVPDTPLLSTQDHGDRTSYAIANRGVRRELRDNLTDEQRADRARSLLSVLELDGPDAHLLDRARLLLILEDASAALDLIHRANEGAGPEDGSRVHNLLADIAEAHPALLDDAGARARMADCLGAGRAAADLAEQLAAKLDPAVDSMRAARRVCETLDVGERNQEALDLAEGVGERADRGCIDFAELCVSAGRVALRTRNTDLARLWRSRARTAVGNLERSDKSLLEVRVRLASLSSALLLFDGRHADSIRYSLTAERMARMARLHLVRARVMNNLGPAYAMLGNTDRAIHFMRRAKRLKAALGDVQGSAVTDVNIGRALERVGKSLEAASVLRRAVSTATRHSYSTTAMRALRALGDIYDHQMNSQLAVQTYERGLAVARASAETSQARLFSHALVPLVAAMGSRARVGQLLAAARRWTPASAPLEARLAMTRTRAISALHLGYQERANRLAAALAGRGDLPFGDHGIDVGEFLLCATQPLPTTQGGPITEEPRASRDLRSRLTTWLRRVARRPSTPPLLPRRLDPARSGRTRGVTGPLRRFTVEALIHAARVCSANRSAPLLQTALVLARTAGELGLVARILAAQALTHSDASSSAALYSEAVGRWAALQVGEQSGRSRTPSEFAAYPDHPPIRHRLSLHDLHAAAHARLLGTNGPSAGTEDGRLASALRRVLAATAKMEAGGGLQQLLADVTDSALEITGAERTCVVLVEGEDLTIRVATSATDRQATLSEEDLSHTVIHRVIAARKPLLLHDVFDDEELLGRPSITNLSLRSILCVPMSLGEELFGVVYADNASAAGSFDNTDLEVLTLFAEQAAAALRTNRLVADLQSSMDELRAMQDRLVRGERLRVIGEMSSGVAHEFNNLLTSILARVQLLNLNYLAPELKRDLQLIEKACLDAAEVVRRLQSFSKKERQGTFRRVDVREVCRDAIEFLRPLWSTRRRRGRPPINVRLDAPAIGVVEGDPTELREVVTNLLKNSLDALAGGGSIVITMGSSEGQTVVSVADDGPGIPEDVLPRVCDPFFTTKGERGTGLGLALSNQIIERHGGTFRVASLPGEGTTIEFTIPAAAGDAAVPVIEHPSVGHAASGTRVLVVDDDPNVREPLAEFLTRAGFEVRAAASGQEGLDMVQEYAPQVVISDVGMPGLNGLEVCRHLSGTAPELPVVLMSGWATGINPTDARQAGATALLAKPFSMRQVTELIGSLVDGEGSGD